MGTPTAGTNGDMTALPQEPRHADGSQLQRLGIQPDITVAPTVKGSEIGHVART